MKRREFISLVGGAAATWPLAASAQQPGRMYRIGVLTAGANTRQEMLRKFLGELGYIERKNAVFEFRAAENRLDRLHELATELVRLKVDVIITAGTLAPLAAKRATATIPIVMAAAGDPVGTGLVASLARPGGNVTGLSLMTTDLGGKRLEILRDLLPGMSRVAVLWNSSNSYPALVFRETERAARTLGVQVLSLEVRGSADFSSALEAAHQQRVSALITVEDPLTNDHRNQITNFTAANRLPAIYGLREYVDAGGLMSYGANLAICTDAAPVTSTKSSKVPSPLICQSSSRPNLNS